MQLTINVHSAEELRELSVMLEDFEKSRRLGLKFKEEQLELPLPEPEAEKPKVKPKAKPKAEPTPEAEPTPVPSLDDMREALSAYASKHGTAPAKTLLDKFGGGVSKIEDDEQKIALIKACAE